MTGYLPTQSFTYNHSREVIVWNIAVKESGKLVESREQARYLYEEAQRIGDMASSETYNRMIRKLDAQIDLIRNDILWELNNAPFTHQYLKDAPQPSLDLLQEYHNKHYAPRNITHKKTLADRFVLAYAHMMVWFGSWLIRVGG